MYSPGKFQEQQCYYVWYLLACSLESFCIFVKGFNHVLYRKISTAAMLYLTSISTGFCVYLSKYWDPDMSPGCMRFFVFFVWLWKTLTMYSPGKFQEQQYYIWYLLACIAVLRFFVCLWKTLTMYSLGKYQYQQCYIWYLLALDFKSTSLSVGIQTWVQAVWNILLSFGCFFLVSAFWSCYYLS